MNTNFHTHTYRCGHASGTDKEFIEAAINSGIKTLGFSDHSPYIGHYIGHAMKIEQLPEYYSSLSLLKEEYKDKIELHIGLEIEYYPEFFNKTIEYIRECKIEYLILGQHSLVPGSCYSVGINSYEESSMFVNICCEAMNTGLFSYIAHPDIFGFDRSDTRYRDLIEKLCNTATNNNMPVEINLLGLATNRIYPCEEYLKIVGELGTNLIIGRDAHYPEAFTDKGTELKALDLIDKYNIKLVDTIDFDRLQL